MIDPVSLATILTAFIPTATYGIKRIIDYKTGGASPSNAAEQVELRKSDVEMVKVINAVPENISRWVANIIALQRPIVIFVILFNWTLLTAHGLTGGTVDLQLYVIVANLASSAIFYLFGDRSLMYSLQSMNKKLLGDK